MGKKTFYTVWDIEEMAKRGVQSLEVDDDVVLTDLAREKAERLNVALMREHDTPPSAPVRPYLSEAAQPKRPESKARGSDQEALFQRVRAAVVGRLGDEIDAKLLDTIIRRVVDNISKG